MNSFCMYVCTALLKKFHDVKMSFLSAEEKRRRSLENCRIYVSTTLLEKLHNVKMSFFRAN